MAKNPPTDRRPLTPARLRALANLTKAIGEAVVQGDLDRAHMLLEQRHKSLQRIAWSAENVQEFEPDLFSLREVDQKLLAFCQTWRDALKKRLETLSACHLLQQCYSRGAPEAKFVDVRK